MSKKETNRDSNTDLFLKLMKKKNSEVKEEKNKIEMNHFDKASVKLYNLSNMINSVLDKVLSSNGALKILSLSLAIILVFAINGGNISNVFTTPTSGDIIYDVPVVVDGLNKDYVVTGVADTVNVMMVGSSLDIYSAKASSNIEVYIDVSNLSRGDHTIELKPRNFPVGLEVVVQPATANINIASKVTQTFPLTHRFYNLDKMDEKYSISIESMEYENIEVRAAQSILEQVHSVEANIDVSNVTNSFEQDAKVYAYDKMGNILPVEITTSTVKVVCDVTSFSKEVNVVARIQGALDDIAIRDINFDYEVVTIYGREEIISNINEVYVDIDANEITKDIVIKDLSVKLTDGINKVSNTLVAATIVVDDVDSKTIEGIAYNFVNNTEKYDINIIDMEDIEIKVTGSKALVANLDSNDLSATIDIKGLPVGTHEVSITITLHNPYLSYDFISNQKITIKIEK